MTKESALAVSAEPEDVPEVEEEGQVETPTAEAPEGEAEEAKKSDAAKRREREKAHKARLQQEAADARAEAERAEARRMKIIEAGKQNAAPAEGDFADYADYVAAKAVWTAERRSDERMAGELASEAEAARAQAEAKAQAEQHIVRTHWNEQVAEARTRFADFDEVALSNEVPIADASVEIITQSDRGADLAYYLGQHRAEAAEIAKLSPTAQAYRLGLIEAKLDLPKPKTETTAPAPITPVKTAGAPATKDPERMSYREFKAYREAK